MTHSRKQPGVAYWATVVVVVVLVVLVGYPLSYGPWMAALGHVPGLSLCGPIYEPLRAAIWNGPDIVIEPYLSYLELWSDSARWVRLLRQVQM